jgi:hypothetical protein
MTRHIASLEVMRYMLPTLVSVTPYFTAGVLATWWVIGDEDVLLDPDVDGTQFRWGGHGAVGLQFRADSNWAFRVEFGRSSVRNPFTGKDSFRALTGVTIDEPTSVSLTDLRIAGVYSFGKPFYLRGRTTPSTTRTRSRR